MFPVYRPGGYIRADWELFPPFIFPFLYFLFSHTKKKTKKKKIRKKRFCVRLTGHNFDHLLEKKQTFFYGQPDIIIQDATFFGKSI